MSNKKNLQKHWNKLYSGTQTEELGWYEVVPSETLHLVEQCKIKKDGKVLVVGAGASTLVDHLLQRGYENLVASDISEESLSRLRNRIGKEFPNIDYVVDDLTDPVELYKHRDVSLWIDRAVLHFLVEGTDRDCYFNLLKDCLRPGGFVIFGEFSQQGVDSCAGLPVLRFSREMLQEGLGDDFQLVDHFNHTYINPSGSPRPYIYTLFRRKK